MASSFFRKHRVLGDDVSTTQYTASISRVSTSFTSAITTAFFTKRYTAISDDLWLCSPKNRTKAGMSAARQCHPSKIFQLATLRHP
jgi:hypothetical protein